MAELTNIQVISWLLEGDISVQYQTYRNLLGIDKRGLRSKIESQGWGLKFLSKRQQDGHWGLGFYQPKWISTHFEMDKPVNPVVGIL